LGVWAVWVVDSVMWVMRGVERGMSWVVAVVGEMCGRGVCGLVC
jgi:hypothetical protein